MRIKIVTIGVNIRTLTRCVAIGTKAGGAQVIPIKNEVIQSSLTFKGSTTPPRPKVRKSVALLWGPPPLDIDKRFPRMEMGFIYDVFYRHF